MQTESQTSQQHSFRTYDQKLEPIAAKAFAAFSASCQNEYSSWIAEAKQDETRKKRVLQAIEWIAKGKSRNWKYQKS